MYIDYTNQCTFLTLIISINSVNLSIFNRHKTAVRKRLTAKKQANRGACGFIAASVLYVQEQEKRKRDKDMRRARRCYCNDGRLIRGQTYFFSSTVVSSSTLDVLQKFLTDSSALSADALVL